MAITQMHRVATTFTGFSGGPFYSQLYFDAASGSAQQHITAVGDFWTDLAGLSSSTLLWSVDGVVDNVNPADGQIGGQEVGTGVTGAATGAGDPLPPANQLIIQMRTGVFVSGRELRGRCNVPGILETRASSGRPDATAISVATSAAQTLQGAGLVVWSRTHGQWQPVNAVGVWNAFAVLRSRRD